MNIVSEQMQHTTQLHSILIYTEFLNTCTRAVHVACRLGKNNFLLFFEIITAHLSQKLDNHNDDERQVVSLQLHALLYIIYTRNIPKRHFN